MNMDPSDVLSPLSHRLHDESRIYAGAAVLALARPYPWHVAARTLVWESYALRLEASQLNRDAGPY